MADQKPSGGPRGERRERSPPMKKKEKKREREREFAPHEKRERERARGGGGGGGGGGGLCSVPLLNISAFIHSPVKCNKSLYMFTRCQLADTANSNCILYD